MRPHLGTIIFNSKLQESENTILGKPEIKSYQFKFKNKQNFSLPLESRSLHHKQKIVCGVQKFVKNIRDFI